MSLSAASSTPSPRERIERYPINPSLASLTRNQVLDLMKEAIQHAVDEDVPIARVIAHAFALAIEPDGDWNDERGAHRLFTAVVTWRVKRPELLADVLQIDGFSSFVVERAERLLTSSSVH